MAEADASRALPLLARATALAPRLPESGFFSHATAARLWDIPLPPRLEAAPSVHVGVPRGRRAVDRRGVVGHALDVAEGALTTLAGVRLTTPARTWRDLGASLGLAHLVAAGDHVLRLGLATRDDLAAEIEEHGFRGRRALHEALELLDPAAESPPESMLRVALVRSGITGLLVNVDVLDPYGRFVARPDLRLRDHPIVIEYDGDGHRADPQQWRRDVARFSALEDLGLSVIRATGDDMPGFERIVARTWDRIAALSRGTANRFAERAS